ncbi:LytTR family two component transcriptional regulator [Azomonas agilis]|uniref:LytTR family two component transcriptional regulator n=1 Tax=Azomonas agilis TaxID=116849 RepID=A0A562IZC9_9GAMM|nr:LytTR family DNA-binding domain-containing protein [Azomonas agilis]TWH76203.1 LytTR family two component transcriptional regulator [Azomonas agilis]
MNVLIVDSNPEIRTQLHHLANQLQDVCVLDSPVVPQPQTRVPDVLLLATTPITREQIQSIQCWNSADQLPGLVLLVDPHVAPGLNQAQSPAAILQPPLTLDNLQQALQQAKPLSCSDLSSLSHQFPRSHLSARTRRGIERVPLDQVLYFMADHKYVTLHHEQGELLLDESLKALETEFGDRLVRIHRNTLVLRSRMERLQRTAQGDIRLYLTGLKDQGLTVSRRQLSSIRRLLPDASAR